MEKNQKKLLAVIISVVLAFTISITAVSFLKMPELGADNSAKLTIGEAESAVLEYAGVQESDVVFTKQEAEIRHGIRIYEFEFTDGTKEYEFKVNAHTGDVISSSSELID